MSADLFTSLQELEVDAIVELWTVDNTVNGGTTYYFHSSNKNGLDTTITFDGVDYVATPINITGVEMSGAGKPRPKMAIGTLGAVGLGLLADFDLLLGATVTRTKTLAKYLDDGSEADTTAVWPTSVFFVEHLESVDDTVAVYRLADPTELPQVKIPRQVVLTNLCSACYRGETCQYAGDPVTDDTNATFGAGPFTDRGTWNATTADYVADDFVSINNPDGTPFVFVVPSVFVGSVAVGLRPGSSGSDLAWKLDTCFKKVADCELRFNSQTVGLNFDAFPGSARIPQ